MLDDDYKPGISNRCESSDPTSLVMFVYRRDGVSVFIIRRKNQAGIRQVKFSGMIPLDAGGDHAPIREFNCGNAMPIGRVKENNVFT